MGKVLEFIGDVIEVTDKANTRIKEDELIKKSKELNFRGEILFPVEGLNPFSKCVFRTKEDAESCLCALGYIYKKDNVFQSPSGHIRTIDRNRFGWRIY